MSSTAPNVIKFTVEDVKSRTQKKSNNVYLGPKIMQQHNIVIGDLVYIYPYDPTNKKTEAINNDYYNFIIAIAWPIQKQPSSVIQIDTICRENLNCSIGSTVYLCKSIYQFINTHSKTQPQLSTITYLNPHLDARLIEIQCQTKSQEIYCQKLENNSLLSNIITSQLLNHYYIIQNQFVVYINGTPCKFKIININQNNNNNIKPIFKITLNSIFKLIIQTNITVKQQQQQPQDNNNNINSLIGGLNKEIQQIKDIIDLTFEKNEIMKSFGIKAPRGILLYGPPGTGKTLLVRSISKLYQAELFIVNGSDILDKYYGVAEKNLQNIFIEAGKKSPSIIFIDELDALCPKRESESTEVEKRVVGSLLTLMDGIESIGRVIVIGCTNRPDSIDSALRRPGRFDNELEISIPNSQGRLEILQVFLSKIPNTLTENQIQEIASKTHGFVGADLESLCKESTLKAFHRLKNQYIQQQIKIEDINVEIQDLQEAMTIVKPSSMREVIVEVPKVHWNDIGGQNEIKQKLKEAIEWPLKYPESFQRMGIKPPKGILLYGPPGCSKTLLAKALATESGLNFLAVKGPELLSKWVGESERAVRDIFKKARQNSPSILFFDEIDGLAITRSGEGSGAIERVVSQLLTEMDGITPLNNVTIIAATNRPDIIDKAIMRAGRIDRILYISPPDKEARREIFNMHFKSIPHDENIDFDMLSMQTDGYSGAEITSICRESSICAMKENVNIDRITMNHIQSAIGNVKKGITQEMLDFYHNYQQQSNLQKL
ncbi:AAA ATPase domain-containing protein [Tieghemostelium lacteum]|uniref:AAA ATPase domain-containing protein n=1 Tax=Tieghemostelium lacteum TaxID=361077 RepID=A0A151ZK37_TIELA|nr:AAA ATPase domain-containing protein [Tieghemostelium lacteum]|eukprot:KYQ94362.1 AAA ATPase domain-containing protein [Tieghemostelium lacteum]